MESSVYYSGDLGFASRLAAACSFIYLCFKALLDSYHSSRLLVPNSTRPSTKWQSSIRNLDGAEIFAFRAARTLGICGLIVLRWCQPQSRHNSDDSYVYSHPAFYMYALALSIASILSNPRWRDITSRQLALLLLVDFLVYFTHDIWPYASLSKDPSELFADPIAWIRIGILTICAIVIPLVMPRPLRLDAQPSEESDHCKKPVTKMSILSRITYSYLDHVVFNAYRTKDVVIADMPPLLEEEKVEVLARRVFKEMDPVQAKKKRHFALSYLSVWRNDYALCTLWALLGTMSDFLGVLGTRNILLFLETGSSPYNLRPWVWIILVGFGPFISACLTTQYLYVGTNIDVEIESSFVYLVFHHALRIRINGNSEHTRKDSNADKADKKVNSDSASVTSTSSNPAQEDEGQEDVIEARLSKGEKAVEQQTRHLVGKINNLITTDVLGMAQAWSVVSLLASIIQLSIALVILYKLVGWSSLVGFALLIILSPAPGYVAKLIAKYEKEQMVMTDKRVQAVTDSLNVLRMIKLFAWEPYMLHRLSKRREDELRKIRTNKILDATMDNLNMLLPAIAKITTFAIYALVIEGDLSASRIFTTLMIFSIVEEHTFKVMGNIPHVLRAKIHFDRYDEFLNNTELLEKKPLVFADTTSEAFATGSVRDEVGFSRCSFSWDAFPTESPTPAAPGTNLHTRRRFELHFDGDVIFKMGSINLIVGPTASGKTSTLMALLGEMYYKPLDAGSWYNLPREGGVAYARQESWVLNDTFKGNILFGNQYNEGRYREVLYCCALDKDLRLWEAGDLTEIGEKGLTLSGGQKARVTLARALYSPASVLLLDDVLAALDVHTAKWVANKALRGDLVKDRTVILVTHNIALMAGIAHYVVDLGRNGTVNAQGTVSEVLKQDMRLNAQMEKEKEELGDGIEIKLDESLDVEGSREATGKLILAEEKPPGRVDFSIYSLYLKTVGNPTTWAIILLSVLANRVSNVGQTWFINVWSSQYEGPSQNEVPAGKYILIYGLIILCSLITDALAKIIWSINALGASRVIHVRLLESIFSATFRWLDITPVGRIITRCTQDIGTIDGNFSFLVGYGLRMTVALVTFLGSAILVAGWYAFFPAIIIACLGTFIGYIYVNCQLAIRRERSNAKAPIVGQVGAALSGLPCIRAFGAQQYFSEALRRQIDIAARTTHAFVGMNRWMAMRIDSLSGLFAAAITTYVVYSGEIDAGLAGFTITVIMSFTRDIVWWARIFNMLEIQATSLERIHGFTQIEHEPIPTESGKPPAYWPSCGGLRVENLSAKYSEDSPEALRDVSFDIAAGERVGIVGRTGAGKSSIALALLRAIPTSGTVIYDGFKTDEINLDALRSNITLIPQQPELISGTLRTNLDPFETHSDAELNDALQVAGLFDVHERPSEQIEASDVSPASGNGGANATDGTGVNQAKAKIGLDTVVDGGGSNFSLGQRQIIALARAIIRKTKLLILDEATAAIDYETDKAIQKTLRTEFSSDTTLITIAHRLQTIMDYDKIIVLDNGRVVEFDTPKNLIRQGGFLRALVDESEDRELLLELAGLSI